MNQPKVVAQVNEVMHQGFEIPFAQLTPEANLFTDLGLDSLDAVDMLVLLEEKIGIKVDGERLMAVRTMQDIYQLVTELVTAPGAKSNFEQ